MEFVWLHYCSAHQAWEDNLLHLAPFILAVSHGATAVQYIHIIGYINSITVCAYTHTRVYSIVSNIRGQY